LFSAPFPARVFFRYRIEITTATMERGSISFCPIVAKNAIGTGVTGILAGEEKK
jgi:hypothetical protein